MELNKIEIGARLKLFRIERKLTLKEIASLCETSAGYISDIERGVSKVSLEIIITLYSNFNLNLIWLLTGEGDCYISNDNNNPIIELLKNKIIKLENLVDSYRDVINDQSKTCDKKREHNGEIRHKGTFAPIVK